MVDDLDLAIHEKLSVITGNDTQAEITRLARRYLVLRRVAVKVYLGGDWIEGDELDADADRLLEGCSSQAQNENPSRFRNQQAQSGDEE